MDTDKLLTIKAHLKEKGKVIPEYIYRDPYHWNSKLYMAKLLYEMGEIKEAYMILRNIYEENTFRFDKATHGAYEEYIIEKVKFFEELAKISLEVTKEPSQSIPYLDEALIMLDGAESVHPYINPSDIAQLKKSYLKMLA
ncbi:MAG: hypothetical protein K0S30_1332 [Clostridia bacterium]|jgi:hypothetical protein|nr:hypothetical protein [Clostridia bacterium]